MNLYPDETQPSSKSKWWLVRYGICLVGILLLIAVITAPLFIRSCPRPPITEAVSNARQIGIALFEFESEYGCMPDFSTVKTVRDKTLTSLKLGTKSSNDFFRQLIAVQICQSEQMFYAKTKGCRKADNVFTDKKALEKGECGFTYFLGAFNGCNPARPLVVAPMISGTDRFDPKPFEGNVVVLRADNSVMTLPIDKHGNAIFEGRNLMDPAHPVWEGKPPSIAWPEL